MNTRAIAAWVLLAVGAGCAAAPDQASVSSEVQMNFGPGLSDWTLAATAGPQGFLGGEIATLAGTTYLVRSDRCGAWSCSGDYQDLYWSKWTGSGWTPGQRIPDQRTSERVSLAAFNGYLYMLHTGETDTNAVWLSKFDPASETWTPNARLSYVTFDGPPAMAVFDGQLQIVGANDECRLWAATLSAGDVPSIARTIPVHSSCVRPSIAVFDGKLYLVHGGGETLGIYVSSRPPGLITAFSPDRVIHTGLDNAALNGFEPVIASVQGYLHLVLRDASANWAWWTYFDGCKWPAPVTLYTRSTTSRPSLTAGGTGLLLATTTNATWNGITETRNIWLDEFHAPAGPLDPPVCGVAKP